MDQGLELFQAFLDALATLGSNLDAALKLLDQLDDLQGVQTLVV